jgi:dTDP-3-amino-3,4,6-trideoxy-alpha-D-glucose transaminase
MRRPQTVLRDPVPSRRPARGRRTGDADGMTRRNVPFMTLSPGGDDAGAIDEAIRRVISRGWFVLGPEVEQFESEFATAMGAKLAVGVGNGTDALALILRALGIGAGDEVITTPLSAAYSALAIAMAGAIPVFADIDPVRFTIDPDRVAALIGPRTRAVMPVHLYGQAADMTSIERLASAHNLAIVEDCCQAHLATAGGRPVGTIGVAGAFSFYPTKNLGALGDGGAVITHDRALADRIKRLRNGGQTDRYHHRELGQNSRLDEIQAAVLRTRLPRLSGWTARRREIAVLYRAALIGGALDLPAECDAGHVYHLFAARARDRSKLQAGLAADGIETLVHYPVPIPRQAAFGAFAATDCPGADEVCREVVSLPLNPRMTNDDVAAVVAAVRRGQTL